MNGDYEHDTVLLKVVSGCSMLMFCIFLLGVLILSLYVGV